MGSKKKLRPPPRFAANDHLLSGENSLLFGILPVGWNWDWHEILKLTLNF